MSSILPKPELTRLVTITAHVDHGKTTLADSLCEHNGIISERYAGTMRYLDSMEEEQRRGITIRSSAIALKHTYRPVKKPGVKTAAGNNKDFVIHLIDSPGHVDFSAEVSSALQVCDGTLLVVDAVEGMCARTHSILREAHLQKLVPILVLNKIDRLCTDLGLSCNQAYVRLRSVIENVNAAASAMIRSAKAQDLDQKQASVPKNKDEGDDDDDEEIEEIWTFEPSKGNIVFSTALYGWGFTIPSLARSLFKSKIIPNYKPPVMRQYLFGDFRYQQETGKILKWKQQQQQQDDDDSKTTMFGEYALRPLWDAMMGVSTAAISVGIESVIFSGHKEVTEAKKKDMEGVRMNATTPGITDMVLSCLQIGPTTSPDASESLQVPTNESDMQKILDKCNASSEDAILRALLRRHRPLSDAVLDAVCDICPSPAAASSHVRSDALTLGKRIKSLTDEAARKEYEDIQNAVLQCTPSPDPMAPTVAHCCKFISTDRAHVNDPELFSHLDSMVDDDAEEESSGIILGVVRVLCGTLTSKCDYHCFGPKYDESSSEDPPKRKLRLYLLMGSTYIRVDCVPAGHICAVFGLEELQLKSVTLSSSKYGSPLNVFNQGMRPLVKVNLEAVSASDTPVLEKGLARLSLADASVEVTATSKGERILACLGEIHLEQSILELKNIYIGKDIDLRVSKPIVDFGESTTWFDNELVDFENFFELKSAPLRQTLIPPYCYEDGIRQALNGRSRVIVSGRGIAMHVRVLPLSINLYRCLEGKTVVNGSENDLQLIAKALSLKTDSPQETLTEMLRLVSSIDSRGNAMMESPRFSDGTCVRAMLATKKNKEIYIPPSLRQEEKSDTADGKEDEKVEKVEIDANAKEVYDELKKRMRNTEIITDEDEGAARRDRFALSVWKSEMRGSVNGGFQAGCAFGPLCEEPLRGVLVVIEGMEMALHERRKKTETDDDFFVTRPVSSGMVVAALKTGIRSALLSRPARLMEGHLRLTLHSSLTGLGPLYDILSKRRGKVLSDTMVDGTDLISIEATIPQSESFGLTPELMEKSSGEVTAPELVFSHWEMLEEDPFWIPTSLEEREDYGEILLTGDISTGVVNHALKYIRMLRDRKGLIVDSHKIVVAAEKQRTLARKK